MLTKDEADRIASAITALRPDWNHAQLMAVLSDKRLRERRIYSDAALALTALALDPTTRQPTRIFEHGPWWEVLAPRVGVASSYREVTDADCAICGRRKESHTPLPNDPHEWESQNARGEGERPTSEQREAIDKAIADAKHAAVAAKEEQPPRKRRDMNDVINSHTDRTDAA